MENDIRWQQRFSNYKKALQQLGEAVALSESRELSDLEKQGMIQAFEFTHELAWTALNRFWMRLFLRVAILSYLIIRRSFTA